jgi:hypothetical protein
MTERPVSADYLQAEIVWLATSTAVFCQYIEIQKSHAALIIFYCMKRK